VFFGLRARSQSKDLNNSDEWDPSLDASAHRADRNAKILLGVGGAAIIGGAVMFYLGHRAGNDSSHVALIPSADGATLAWSLRFQ
jgi:fibrillarin-like rRNA methylase